MLTQLALLPLLAVTVTGVTSETHDSDVVIDVATSEPVPARAVRPMTGTSLLYVFVDGATPDRAVFENGDHPVAARTRARYTKLEIPLDPGMRCREPASVATLDSGLRVQFSCGAKAGEMATAEAPGRRLRRLRPKPNPSPRLAAPRRSCCGRAGSARREPFADKTENEEDENREPSLWPKPSPASKPRPPAQVPSRRRLPYPQPRRYLPSRPSPSTRSQGVVPRATPGRACDACCRARDACCPAHGPCQRRGAGSQFLCSDGRSRRSPPFRFVVGPGRRLLVAVGGGVLVLTRRRTRRPGLIQILETAAIGPKRALLVARVNGQTMVLGASEAGIALLGSLEGKTEPQVAAVMGNLPAVKGQPDDSGPEVTIDAPSEPEGEIGMLSRLFRLRPQRVVRARCGRLP